MSEHKAQVLSRYVQVLEQRAQQAQVALTQRQAQLMRSEAQLQRLEQMRHVAQLKISTTNVALYGNAAGFRSSLMDMAQQFSDTCAVQRLEVQRAQKDMQAALQRHESMHGVMSKAQAVCATEQVRQGQKSMDEMAGQAWMRQRAAIAAQNGNR